MDATTGGAVAEMPQRHMTLLEEFDAGKRTALARAISIVENGRRDFAALLHALHPRLGQGHRIGITGPPGAGKSTLTAALIAALRERGETVGVVAVDPSSPFTGGALLGDRIRMNDVALDEGVFIRSMASRGSLGGLAVTTKEVADVMDAFGFDRVLIETVGVGQAELDIAGAADTTVVVLVPESGDAIQAMKAGLMEISDLFVINKADRPGAERMAREIEMMLHFRAGDLRRNVPAHHGVDLSRVAAKRKAGGASPDRGGANADRPHTRAAEAGSGGEGSGDDVAETTWSIPVLQTKAHRGEGVTELLDSLDGHMAWLRESGELSLRRRQRLAVRVREVVQRELLTEIWQRGGGEAMLERVLPSLEAGESSPYEVATRILRDATAGGPEGQAVNSAGDDGRTEEEGRT